MSDEAGAEKRAADAASAPPVTKRKRASKWATSEAEPAAAPAAVAAVAAAPAQVGHHAAALPPLG